MSNASRGDARARRVVKNRAMVPQKNPQVHKMEELKCGVAGAAAAAFIYRQQHRPHQPASLLSTIHQRHRDDMFGDKGLFCDDCRQRGGIRQMEGL